MKKLVLLAAISWVFICARAQNPFVEYGYLPKISTLSKGQYFEFFDNDTIVQIGTVLYNTRLRKVVAFVDSEIQNTEGAVQPDLASRWISPDPLAEQYPNWSPYNYVANNPLKFIDPDGEKIRIANNYAGAMESMAKIAATSLGSQILNHLISKEEIYTLNSTFLTSSSSYDPNDRYINYVGNPLYNEIPFDGGALNSMIAMGHESFHAFDHSNNIFNENNAAYRRSIVEPRAVSFGNYLRQEYSMSPLRKQYGNIKGNFHQFSANDQISDFTTLGNNSDKTSFGFSYTKTTTTILSYKNFLGIKIPDKTKTETSKYFMTVSMDKNKNASYQIYDNEQEYKKMTSNW